MRFQILTADAAGIARWHSLIDRLPAQKKDIHFLPEYGDVYRKTYGQEPFLATYGDENHFVVQSFVKRSLNNLPFLADRCGSADFYDIANPYGYGGPVFRCEDTEQAMMLFEEFNAHFLAYCQEEQLASEFASLHPFLETWPLIQNSGMIYPVRQKRVVYLDLSGAAEQWSKAIRKGHKSSISRARKRGVRIERVEPTAERFDVLNRLYYATMERNRAERRWFFPPDYFRNCYECLGKQRVSLFFAYAGNALASACILMHDFDTCYYHFSGSDEGFREYCPTHLLIWEVAAWAETTGYRRFHLGGGVTSDPGDHLLLFKSGFSGMTADLYTYYRVLHRPTYDLLCELKREHELATTGKISQSDFFPLYRR